MTYFQLKYNQYEFYDITFYITIVNIHMLPSLSLLDVNDFLFGGRRIGSSAVAINKFCW